MESRAPGAGPGHHLPAGRRAGGPRAGSRSGRAAPMLLESRPRRQGHRTSCSLRLELVEDRERIVDGELPEVTEPRLVGEFPRLRLAHRGPDAGTALGERCRHAVEGADRIEKLTERIDVLLHPRRATHL